MACAGFEERRSVGTTDLVIEEMTDWSACPLDEVDVFVLIDAIVVKVRDGRVRQLVDPRSSSASTSTVKRDNILGLWAGTVGEGG